MATSTELLRAAEHMRERARETHLVDLFATARHLEDEAKRLQDIEAQAERENRCKKCGRLPHDPGYCTYRDEMLESITISDPSSP